MESHGSVESESGYSYLIYMLVITFFFFFSAPKTSRKRASEKEQTASKIVVRNIPFEATEKEIRELFRYFLYFIEHLAWMHIPLFVEIWHRNCKLSQIV